MTNNPHTDERRERYAAALLGPDAAGTLDSAADEMLDAVMAVADAELAARRAADLRDAEEICDEAGASYTAKALNEQADGAYGLMARFRRKAEEAEQTAAASPAVPVPPTTHADDEERRQRYAVAIREAGDTAYGNRPFYEAITDAVLAVADAERAATRAIVLREAADRYAKLADQNEAYDREQGDLDEEARLQHGTVRDVAAGLRRLAAEAQQQEPARSDVGTEFVRQADQPDEAGLAAFEADRADTGDDHSCAEAGCSGEPGPAQQPDTGTQAHPPHHRWYVETRDGLADEWAPGMRFAVQPAAAERLRDLNEHHPRWADGTAVQRRLVRETTTYTVEQSAVVAEQPAAADNGEEAGA